MNAREFMSLMPSSLCLSPFQLDAAGHMARFKTLEPRRLLFVSVHPLIVCKSRRRFEHVEMCSEEDKRMQMISAGHNEL